MQRPTKAIITDAGYASRYLPITKTIPKAMLPFGNKPIIQMAVEECAEAGIRKLSSSLPQRENPFMRIILATQSIIFANNW
ncbi:hypothetical protein IPF89_01990 [Candidatus Saccharibacteria bacterium]|nr:MAG: hypothetical protein IPF89_01990 [Candidatus Saccharibacteria bacterium]